MTTLRGRVRVEAGAKRVRVVFGGQVVADSVRPLLVWEKPQYPTYYLPLDDVESHLLRATGATRRSPSRGDGALFAVRVGDREAPDAALVYEDSPVPELRGHVRFEWHAMDAWFEEDEEVYTHPRDPYTRVDVLASSRYIRVVIDGVTVAESTSPRLLFETNLPTRYYLPKTDVRLDLLEPSGTVTRCPYKGQAEYWSVDTGDRLHRDVVWSYRAPLPESQKIAGLMAFHNEKVDIYVDGVLERHTP